MIHIYSNNSKLGSILKSLYKVLLSRFRIYPIQCSVNINNIQPIIYTIVSNDIKTYIWQIITFQTSIASLNLIKCTCTYTWQIHTYLTLIDYIPNHVYSLWLRHSKSCPFKSTHYTYVLLPQKALHCRNIDCDNVHDSENSIWYKGRYADKLKYIFF